MPDDTNPDPADGRMAAAPDSKVQPTIGHVPHYVDEANLVPDPHRRPHHWYDPKTDTVLDMPPDWQPQKGATIVDYKPTDPTEVANQVKPRVLPTHLPRVDAENVEIADLLADDEMAQTTTIAPEGDESNAVPATDQLAPDAVIPPDGEATTQRGGPNGDATNTPNPDADALSADVAAVKA